MSVAFPVEGIDTVDYHTAGEPLRIVTRGLPPIPGSSMMDRRRWAIENLDGLRRTLMLEPRGHADMYGAFITPPASEDGDVGVLFLHNEGFSTMCGHGIIGLVTAATEHGLFEVRGEEVRIDTPAGRVTATAVMGERGVNAVRFENVPSFVLRENISLNVRGRTVRVTVAFGGAFYAYVDARDAGLSLSKDHASEVIALGRELKAAYNAQHQVEHPTGDPDLGFLYGVIFVEPGEQPGHSRNACVFAEGELDRSPTGTGVSGRAAIHFARGEIGPGEWLTIDSLIGTAFRVRCLRQTQVGALPGVVTEVEGSAWQTGQHHFVVREGDPLADGLLIR